MSNMKKSLALFAALALVASACGPSESAVSNGRVKNNALPTSTTATVPGTPPQIFLKIDTIDLAKEALQGTPKFVAQLRWSAPLNDGGSPITGYEIQFRWNAFERSKSNFDRYKNWTSCAEEDRIVPGTFPACSAAKTSTATTAEISSDYWQSFSKKEESHLVQGLEYRVAAINAIGLSDFSPETQQTCKYGGACEFGDLGPGGGVVYDVPPASPTRTGWMSNGASEVAGADWEYSAKHSWAAMVWAGETNCPGWSCYAPTPPQPCLKTNTSPVRYASSYDTCLRRDAWHLPFAMPMNNTAEWRPLCNRFDDLNRTWAKLRGGNGVFYWSASKPIIPAGISINLSVTNVVTIISSPGIGALAEVAQDNYNNWSTSSIVQTQAIRFPCESATKNVTGNYDSQGQLKASDGSTYHDNSVRSSIGKKENLSRPIRFFTTNKAAIAPQVAPRLVAATGDGGVALAWTAGTPSTSLAAAIATAQILPLTSYAIEYKPSSAAEWTRVPGSSSVNMSRVIGNEVLKSNVAYDFRVAEVNSLGVGPFSETATATPGKFVQRALSVTTTSGTFPSVDLATSGGEGSGAVTYAAANGTATGCSIQVNRLSVTRTGTCIVTATKAGDGSFLAASSAPQTVAVAPGPQDPLSITSLTSPFDKPLPLVAEGGSGAGEVTFTVGEFDRSVCSITSNKLTFAPPTPGTGSCRVAATKAASDNFVAATTALTTITFTRGSQAPIVIDAPPSVKVPAQKVVVTARGGSGLGEPTFNVRNGTAGNCAVSTTSVRAGVISTDVSANGFGSAPLSAGTCIVTVTKVGDATYTAATSSEATVTFGKGPQESLRFAADAATAGAFTGLELQTAGGSGSGAVTFSIVDRNPSTSAWSKAPNCRVVGSRLVADAPGVCWVTPTKAADNTYEATTGTPTEFKLNQAPQPPLTVAVLPATGAVGVSTTVTLSVNGGAGTGAITRGIRNGTARGCALTGNSITAESVGTCIITASKASDSSYNPAQAETTFTMTIGQQAALSIPSGLRGQALALDIPVALSTSGGSGSGAVTYTVTDAGTAQCTLDGNKVSARSAGQCSVSATKAGDASFAEVKSAAVPVVFDIRVGDRAETGGTIAYVADTPQPWGRYIELAPANWNGATAPLVEWAAAFPLVDAYRGGDRLDWRLPSNAEKALMGSSFPSNTWTFDAAPGGTAGVRPIRTFG